MVNKNMKLIRESKTSFIRNKKGRVVRVVRSGDDHNIDSKIREYNQKRRSEAKAKRKKYYKKQKKAVRQTVNRISRNAESANRWLLGEEPKKKTKTHKRKQPNNPSKKRKNKKNTSSKGKTKYIIRNGVAYPVYKK